MFPLTIIYCSPTPIPIENNASFFWTIQSLQTKHPCSHYENFWLHPLNMVKVVKAFGNCRPGVWPINRVLSLYACFSRHDDTICIMTLILDTPAGVFLGVMYGWGEAIATLNKRESSNIAAVN